MFKKVVVGTLVTAISAGLIYGAINRTNARSDHPVEDRLTGQDSIGNRGSGLAASENRDLQIAEEGQNKSQVRGGQGGRNLDGSQGQATEKSGQAAVSEWLSIFGTVVAVADDTMQVQAEQGGLITIEGMTLRFAKEQGLLLQVGMVVELRGFMEGEDFEIGEITDLSSGLMISLREESGRPLWAGGPGRRGA